MDVVETKKNFKDLVANSLPSRLMTTGMLLTKQDDLVYEPSMATSKKRIKDSETFIEDVFKPTPEVMREMKHVKCCLGNSDSVSNTNTIPVIIDFVFDNFALNVYSWRTSVPDAIANYYTTVVNDFFAIFERKKTIKDCFNLTTKEDVEIYASLFVREGYNYVASDYAVKTVKETLIEN